MDVLQMMVSPKGRYVYYYPRGYPAPLVQYDVKTGRKREKNEKRMKGKVRRQKAKGKRDKAKGIRERIQVNRRGKSPCLPWFIPTDNGLLTTNNFKTGKTSENNKRTGRL